QGRVVAANVPAQRLELVFGAFGGKVGNLRLETTYMGRRGIDNGTAEFEDGVGAALQFGREPGRVGVEAHHEQGRGMRPGGVELFFEGHGMRRRGVGANEADAVDYRKERKEPRRADAFRGSGCGARRRRVAAQTGVWRGDR